MPDELTLWETRLYPGTCQLMTDVDEATGQLRLMVYGVGEAPLPPAVTPAVWRVRTELEVAADGTLTAKDTSVWKVAAP